MMMMMMIMMIVNIYSTRVGHWHILVVYNSHSTQFHMQRHTATLKERGAILVVTNTTISEGKGATVLVSHDYAFPCASAAIMAKTDAFACGAAVS